MRHGLKSSTMKLSDPALTSGSSSESRSWNTNSSSGLCSDPASSGVSLEECRLLHKDTWGHLPCPHLPCSSGLLLHGVRIWPAFCPRPQQARRRRASCARGSPGLTEGLERLVTCWAEAELSLPLALLTQQYIGLVLEVWSLKAVSELPGVYQRDRIPHPITELMNQILHSNQSPRDACAH